MVGWTPFVAQVTRSRKPLAYSMKNLPFLPDVPELSDEGSFSRLVSWARERPRTADEVAALAHRLAASGEQLSWLHESVADVASTGGPGSLSTLIAPLALRGHECTVVKLAVPGRPAGAIDVLGTLPGYRVRATSEQVRETVRRCGFAHFLADARFAPLDASLFQYRQRVGAVAIPALAAASLLAKKIAVGVRFVGLDVRVGEHGNFGATVAEARQNAGLFCEAARALGIHAAAFLSTGIPLAQPWIGRGESVLALACAVGAYTPDRHDSWFSAHVDQCLRMASVTANVTNDTPGTGEAFSPCLVNQDTLRRHLEVHLEAQGSSIEALAARACEIDEAPTYTFEAPADGLLFVDLAIVRAVIMELQPNRSDGIFADAIGLYFLQKPGKSVTIGEPIVNLRCKDTTMVTSVIERLKKGIEIRTPRLPPPDNREEGSELTTSMEIVYA